MRFDWDGRKAASNLLKHRLSFEEAITAFDDPFALVAPDPRHSTATEERRWLIGESGLGDRVYRKATRQRLPPHQRAARQSEGANPL